MPAGIYVAAPLPPLLLEGENDDDTMGYPGKRERACENPGSLVSVLGSVGGTPEAASGAIKTRSLPGGG